MIEGIPVDLVDGIGVVGVVVLVGVLIATGRLVTRREADQIAHDRDEWRTESRLKDQQIAEKDEQLAHMGELGRLVKDIVLSLQARQRDGVER